MAKAVKPKISAKTVIRALYHLRADRLGVRVSPDAIAEYLEAPVEDINAHLRELEATRLYRRKKSKGETYIAPWEGQQWPK